MQISRFVKHKLDLQFDTSHLLSCWNRRKLDVLAGLADGSMANSENEALEKFLKTAVYISGLRPELRPENVRVMFRHFGMPTRA